MCDISSDASSFKFVVKIDSDYTGGYIIDFGENGKIVYYKEVTITTPIGALDDP